MKLGLAITNHGNRYKFRGNKFSLLPYLLAYYPLNEASGVRADIHTGGYNLTQSAVAVGQGIGHVYANAADFDYQTAQYLYRDRTIFNFNINSNFSVCFWVKLDTLEHPTESPDYYRFLYGIGAASTWASGYNVKTTSGSAIYCTFNLGSGPGTQYGWHTGKAIGTTGWAMTTLTQQANGNGTANVAFYVNNGAPATGINTIGFNSATSGNFEIGKKPTATVNYFDGQMGPLMIFNKTLSAEDVSWLYNDGAGRIYNEF